MAEHFISLFSEILVYFVQLIKLRFLDFQAAPKLFPSATKLWGKIFQFLVFEFNLFDYKDKLAVNEKHK